MSAVSRIDTLELKIRMERRLGLEKSKKYFNLLTRYLSLKVPKSEFDMLCISLIGKENVVHHNQLLISVLKNAINSKQPPSKKVEHGVLAFKNSNGTDPPQSSTNETNTNLRKRKFEEETQTTHGERVEKESLIPSINTRIPNTAPYGVTVHSNKKRRVPCRGAYNTCHYLEKRVKENLKMKGFNVSVDCMNLLNNGLDSYLKGFIKGSLQEALSRSTTSRSKPIIHVEDVCIQLEKSLFEK